jgi:hypothetical protein
VRYFAEKIGGMTMAQAKLKVVAGNVHHARIVAVFFKQDIAENKEIRVAYDIILQNDSFLFGTKKPVDSLGDAFRPSHVFFPEKRSYLARPINLFHNAPRLQAQSFVIGIIRAWPVGSHIQARRTRFADGGKGSPGMPGTVE